MNYQPIIDNIHFIFPGIGLLLWGLSKLFSAVGQAIHGDDFFERQAPRLKWASDTYSRALDWLVDAGASKLKGAEKLVEVTKRVNEFERLWDAGKYVEAIAHISGYQQAALDKLKKAGLPVPFDSIPRPPTIPADGATIGPDDIATE